MELSDASKRMGTRIDGFLGQYMLREFAAIRIDYKNHVLELEQWGRHGAGVTHGKRKMDCKGATPWNRTSCSSGVPKPYQNPIGRMQCTCLGVSEATRRRL